MLTCVRGRDLVAQDLGLDEVACRKPEEGGVSKAGRKGRVELDALKRRRPFPSFAHLLQSVTPA